MITDPGQSIGKNQYNFPRQIESGNEAKSLDKITNLKPKELPVHLLEPRKGLPEAFDESHLQTGLPDAQYVQIFGKTPRPTTPAPSSVGSKKEAGLEEILRKTPT